MNLNDQKSAFSTYISSVQSTMFRKGNDYADEDRLANFKRAGMITGISPELNCLNLIATKVARLGVLLNKESDQTEYESIDDSILDLTCYAILLHMIRKDKAQE